VEGQRGLDRVKALAELEMEFGFRSSFNFIPEGEYHVSSELRQWLTDRGFEVGVHDLHHDGKLYTSRDAFYHKAQKINHYLKEWNAVGFPFRLHVAESRLAGDLNIQYDGSTFDTDPFEPQPDGAGTIFPFWVERGPAGVGRGTEDEGQPSRAKRSEAKIASPTESYSAEAKQPVADCRRAKDRRRKSNMESRRSDIGSQSAPPFVFDCLLRLRIRRTSLHASSGLDAFPAAARDDAGSLAQKTGMGGGTRRARHAYCSPGLHSVAG
jgi:hypothetical protein